LSPRRSRSPSRKRRHLPRRSRRLSLPLSRLMGVPKLKMKRRTRRHSIEDVEVAVAEAAVVVVHAPALKDPAKMKMASRRPLRVARDAVVAVEVADSAAEEEAASRARSSPEAVEEAQEAVAVEGAVAVLPRMVPLKLPPPMHPPLLRTEKFDGGKSLPLKDISAGRDEGSHIAC
jgi:hypothetical protein